MEFTEIIEVKDRQQHNSWFGAIVVVLIIIAIAYIWQRNNCVKLAEAKELGELKAKTCYDHEYVSLLGSRQRQDEEFAFWERPSHEHKGHCGNGYGNSYGYGNGCGNGYSNPWPVNGCPQYPIVQTKFEKLQHYEAKGPGDITEVTTV
jgi:hypothetical protein